MINLLGFIIHNVLNQGSVRSLAALGRSQCGYRLKLQAVTPPDTALPETKT